MLELIHFLIGLVVGLVVGLFGVAHLVSHLAGKLAEGAFAPAAPADRHQDAPAARPDALQASVSSQLVHELNAYERGRSDLLARVNARAYPRGTPENDSAWSKRARCSWCEKIAAAARTALGPRHVVRDTERQRPG